jgi:hypothetical protein
VAAESKDESLMAVEICGLVKDFGHSIPSTGANQEIDLGIAQLRSQTAKIPSCQQIQSDPLSPSLLILPQKVGAEVTPAESLRDRLGRG